jgi:hypothetical protein
LQKEIFLSNFEKPVWFWLVQVKYLQIRIYINNIFGNYDNGNLFKNLLELGKTTGNELQLITWSDFGEGANNRTNLGI